MKLIGLFLWQPEDITSVSSIKLAVKYAQRGEVESEDYREGAPESKSGPFRKGIEGLQGWQVVFLVSSLSFIYLTAVSFIELSSDPAICSHHAALYDTLLE
jgi:hypothetical protein